MLLHYPYRQYPNRPYQEVDVDMMPRLNNALGRGGGYRCYPSRIPVERRYFTMVFVRVATVAVQDSDREVGGADSNTQATDL